MVERSEVTFEQLQRLLFDLGFTESRQASSWRFEHRSTGAILVYRLYRPRDRITQKDLVVTRQDLDWRDLMAAERFDEAFQKAIA